MDTQPHTQNSLAGLAPRTGYRGPFSLGLSRIARARSRGSASSRSMAVGCFMLAMAIGLATAQWLLSAPVSSSLGTRSLVSSEQWSLMDSVGLLGGLGLSMSVGLSLAGVWFWPFQHRTRVLPREESMAAYDRVTGLPTLRLFTVLLDQALTRASHLGRSVGVLVAELNQYRPLPTSATTPNLSLIVRVQAARIKGALSSNNTVARIGERRFAILIEEVIARDHIDAAAQNIYRAMALPLMIEGQEVLLTCQIGGAMYSSSAASGEAVLSQAVKSLAHATSENPIRFADTFGDVPANRSSVGRTPAIEPLLR